MQNVVCFHRYHVGNCNCVQISRNTLQKAKYLLKNRHVVIETKTPRRLSKLTIRAEKVAKTCPKHDRKSIREFLRENGVAGEIDGVVKELLPEYV